MKMLSGKCTEHACFVPSISHCFADKSMVMAAGGRQRQMECVDVCFCQHVCVREPPHRCWRSTAVAYPLHEGGSGAAWQLLDCIFQVIPK